MRCRETAFRLRPSRRNTGAHPVLRFQVVTKSGTNDFHGTAFEYFRNDVLDANNWFADHAGLRKPELQGRTTSVACWAARS